MGPGSGALRQPPPPQWSHVVVKDVAPCHVSTLHEHKVSLEISMLGIKTSNVWFVMYLQEHWFTIRQACGGWWNFNSLFPAPEALSPFYLAAFLATMREQGYVLFLPPSQLPSSAGVD